MNKRLTAFVLTGVLACGMAVPALADDRADLTPARPGLTIATRPGMLISPRPDLVISGNPQLPDSRLFYGEVQEVRQVGDATHVRMHSDRDGEKVLVVSAATVFVDSGAGTAAPRELKAGDRAYVFHSTTETRSLPPQTQAFAVVVNIPMDVGCAQYREVEAVEQKDGMLRITSENGSRVYLADQDTELVAYDGTPVAAEAVKSGGFMMVWERDPYGSSAAREVEAGRLMFLPGAEKEENSDPLTRGQLAVLLHEKAGKPVVNYLMQFRDVDQAAPEGEAIRWLAGEQAMQGYDDFTFGTDDVVTLEQAVTVLWRLNRSPKLMDYPGLTQFEDAGDISSFAGYALAWAHQQGMLADKTTHLEPGAPLTRGQADALLEGLSFRK